MIYSSRFWLTTCMKQELLFVDSKSCFDVRTVCTSKLNAKSVEIYKSNHLLGCQESIVFRKSVILSKCLPRNSIFSLFLFCVCPCLLVPSLQERGTFAKKYRSYPACRYRISCFFFLEWQRRQPSSFEPASFTS